MKKILLTITVSFVALLTMAQSPNLMNYQGVARNAVGNVIPNQQIALRLSILTGSAGGSVVYSETRNVFTNAFGLFNVVLGSPGTLAQTGTIAGVNWSGFPSGGANKYLQVEIDPQGGSNFVNVGATQMVSVPYALNAGGAAPIGPAGGDLTGTYPNPQILIPLIKTQNVPLTPMIGMTNTSTTGILGAIQGSSASNDANAVGMQGTITSTAPGGFSAGVRGTNSGTGGNGIGVVGTQNGSGWGVYGQTPAGIGVRGETNSGYGVYGLANTNGIGVYGTSSANTSAFFQNTTAANTSATLTVATNGVGDGLSAVNTGTGRAGFFQVLNAASTASALEATTNGIGASWGFRSSSTGTNGAGLFVQNNATNTANNIQSNQTGLGTAGFFQNSNTANASDVILATTNTTSTTPAAVHGNAGTSGTTVAAKKGVWGDSDTGWGVYGTSSTSVGVGGTTTTGTGVSAFAFSTGTALAAQSLTGIGASILLPAGNASTSLTATTAGTGVTGNFDNSNAANVSNTLQSINVNGASGVTSPTTGGGAALFARKGAALASWLTNPSAVYATSSDPVGIGMAALTNVNIATFGGTVGVGAGVYGATFGTGGTALVGNGTSSASSYGLVTGGRIQFQGQGAGAGKILSSDAVGNATWNTLASLGGVSGTGTLNWVPKWTPNGTTLGNSQIFDDGTNVGVGTGSPNAKLDVANGSNTVRGAQIINSSTTNTTSTIFAQNNSVGGVDPIESAAVTGVLSPIAVATPIITGPSALKGISAANATIGALGGIGVQGASGNGYGVAGISNNGTGVYAYGVNGTSYALQTNGRVQIQGQGAGAGKLFSSDAVGNGTWNTAASLNIVSGNGNLNLVTKWTPDGNTIGNSQIRDDGTRVSIGTAFNDPNSLNINPTSVSTPNASMEITSTNEIFGMYIDDATGRLHFTANNGSVVAGNEIMVLDDDGVRGVGIGTPSPLAKLHAVNTTASTVALSTLAVYGVTTSGVTATGSRYDPANPAGYFVANGGAGQGVYATATAAYNAGGVGSPTAMAVSAVGLSAGISQQRTIQSVAGNGIDYNFGIRSYLEGTAGSGYNAAINGVDNMNVANSYAGYFDGKVIINGNTQINGTTQIVDGTQGANKVLTSDASGNASWQSPIPAVSFRAHGLPSQSTAGFSINGANTWQTIDYEQTPGASNWNGATGEYTIPVTGMYHIDAQLELSGFTTPAGGRGNLLIDLNGGILLGSNHQINSVNFNVLTINTDYYFTAGQKVSMHFFLAGAGNGTLAGNYVNDNFSIHLVR